MAFSILEFEHKVAILAHDTVKESKHILDVIIPALQKVAGSEHSVEAVSGLVNPAAVSFERAGYTALGLLLKALKDLKGVADAPSTVLNVVVTAQLLADFHAVSASIHDIAAVKSVTL